MPPPHLFPFAEKGRNSNYIFFLSHPDSLKAFLFPKRVGLWAEGWRTAGEGEWNPIKHEPEFGILLPFPREGHQTLYLAGGKMEEKRSDLFRSGIPQAKSSAKGERENNLSLPFFISLALRQRRRRRRRNVMAAVSSPLLVAKKNV